jgi:hypothetical protein
MRGEGGTVKMWFRQALLPPAGPDQAGGKEEQYEHPGDETAFGHDWWLISVKRRYSQVVTGTSKIQRMTGNTRQKG